MTAIRRHRRSGVTLIEVLAVLSVLIILGGVVLPTLYGFQRDTKIKAAGDMIRGRIAEARASAIGQVRAYCLYVSTDGTRVRIAPDDSDFASATFTEDDEAPVVAEEELPKPVTATPLFANTGQGGMDEGGWIQVATFLSDGTCKEDSAELELKEPGCYSLRVKIRGLTGAATVSPAPTTQGTGP